MEHKSRSPSSDSSDTAQHVVTTACLYESKTLIWPVGIEPPSKNRDSVQGWGAIKKEPA